MTNNMGVLLEAATMVPLTPALRLLNAELPAPTPEEINVVVTHVARHDNCVGYCPIRKCWVGYVCTEQPREASPYPESYRYKK